MFKCPRCEEEQLEICQSFELPPGARWDEESLQMIACNSCESAGLAVYQESRRGASDEESVHHEGAFLPMKELMTVRATLLLCPEPSNGRCGCAAHKELRGLTDAVLLKKLFPMKR